MRTPLEKPVIDKSDNYPYLRAVKDMLMARYKNYDLMIGDLFAKWVNEEYTPWDALNSDFNYVFEYWVMHLLGTDDELRYLNTQERCYAAYVREWYEDHCSVEFEGMMPASLDEYLDNEFLDMDATIRTLIRMEDPDIVVEYLDEIKD